jgi:hypothetical protein
MIMSDRQNLISYCGLYCGDCPAYTQSIANLAKELRQELRRSKCDKAAPALGKIPSFGAFKHYRQFCDLLGTMIKMRCKKPCRTGGGYAQCRIKKCVKKKGLLGCWQCDDFPACTTLGTLEEYGDVDRTYLKNLRKIRRQGPAAFIKAKSR